MEMKVKLKIILDDFIVWSWWYELVFSEVSWYRISEDGVERNYVITLPQRLTKVCNQ